MATRFVPSENPDKIVRKMELESGWVRRLHKSLLVNMHIDEATEAHKNSWSSARKQFCLALVLYEHI